MSHSVWGERGEPSGNRGNCCADTIIRLTGEDRWKFAEARTCTWANSQQAIKRRFLSYVIRTRCNSAVGSSIRPAFQGRRFSANLARRELRRYPAGRVGELYALWQTTRGHERFSLCSPPLPPPPPPPPSTPHRPTEIWRTAVSGISIKIFENSESRSFWSGKISSGPTKAELNCTTEMLGFWLV